MILRFIAIALLIAAPLIAAAGETNAPVTMENTGAETSEAPKSGEKLRLEEVEIQGEIEKPKIFFILPKAQREAENRERRIRFYPDILEPLDKDRFEEEARVLYQHGIPAE